MKNLLSIARALLHEPLVLLMDVPESGLDQEALGMLDALVSNGSNPRRTVVLTTHSLERAFAVGQRMAILANGKVAYQESLEDAGTEAIRDAYMRHTGVAT